MAEYEQKKRDADEKTPRRRKALDAAEKVKSRKESPEANAMDVPSVEGHAALLSDARLSHPANAGQKADIVSGLQRRYGNAYVQRLLSSRGVQAKLTVNPPDDQYEKEADRVAEAVAKAPEGQAQRQSEEEEEPVQGKAAGSQIAEGVRRQPEEEEEPIQPKVEAGRTPAVSEELEGRINAARGGGEPLADSVRASVEPHFERDLSAVRVHTDAEADALSHQLSARAFTTGHDVFFREGEYQPESEGGRSLIGHELTHVVQQGAAPISRKPAEAKEKEDVNAKGQLIEQLKKARDRALSAMSAPNLKNLLMQVALCQQMGATESAKDALDQVAEKALSAVKRQGNTPNVLTTSRRIVNDLLYQLDRAKILDGNGKAKAADAVLDRLLQWARAQLTGVMKQLQSSPGEPAARDVIEKAALVQMLGGDTAAAIGALKTWAETEKA